MKVVEAHPIGNNHCTIIVNFNDLIVKRHCITCVKQKTSQLHCNNVFSHPIDSARKLVNTTQSENDKTFEICKYNRSNFSESNKREISFNEGLIEFMACFYLCLRRH